MRTRCMGQRVVHLVDVENAVGRGNLTVADVARVRSGYMRLGLVGPVDQVILGSSHHNLMAAGLGWPDARRLVRSGRDGADLVLREVMEDEHLEHRFGACVVVTGDGGFANPIARLVGRGLTVAVIGTVGRTAGGLRLPATVVCEVDLAAGGIDVRSAS